MIHLAISSSEEKNARYSPRFPRNTLLAPRERKWVNRTFNSARRCHGRAPFFRTLYFCTALSPRVLVFLPLFHLLRAPERFISSQKTFPLFPRNSRRCFRTPALRGALLPGGVNNKFNATFSMESWGNVRRLVSNYINHLPMRIHSLKRLYSSHCLCSSFTLSRRCNVDAARRIDAVTSRTARRSSTPPTFPSSGNADSRDGRHRTERTASPFDRLSARVQFRSVPCPKTRPLFPRFKTGRREAFETLVCSNFARSPRKNGGIALYAPAFPVHRVASEKQLSVSRPGRQVGWRCACASSAFSAARRVGGRLHPFPPRRACARVYLGRGGRRVCAYGCVRVCPFSEPARNARGR